MVGAVNRIASPPLAQRQTVAIRDPAPPAHRAGTEGRIPADAASEILSRARRTEMESLLVSMASAPPGADRMAAQSLQTAERKLARLKAEARAAAASGDRRAARAIARDLAVLARQIADAAQDYAVAQARPDVVSPALAKAAARMNVAGDLPDAGDASDAGAMVGEAAAAEADVEQVATATEDAGTPRPDSTAIDAESRRIEQPADQDQARGPNMTPPSGSDGAHDEGILIKAHRLFKDAVDLLRALEAVVSRRPSWASRLGLAAPALLPVWPYATVSAGTGPLAVSIPAPVATHGQ